MTNSPSHSSRRRALDIPRRPLYQFAALAAAFAVLVFIAAGPLAALEVGVGLVLMWAAPILAIHWTRRRVVPHKVRPGRPFTQPTLAWIVLAGPIGGAAPSCLLAIAYAVTGHVPLLTIAGFGLANAMYLLTRVARDGTRTSRATGVFLLLPNRAPYTRAWRVTYAIAGFGLANAMYLLTRVARDGTRTSRATGVLLLLPNRAPYTRAWRVTYVITWLAVAGGFACLFG